MKLSNSVIQDMKISSGAFIVYLGIRSAFGDTHKHVPISTNYLSYILTGNPKHSTLLDRSIVSGISELENKKLIKIIDSQSPTKIISVENAIPKEGEYFSLIEDNEVKKILNYSGSKYDQSILRLFCVLISTMSKDKLENIYVGMCRHEDILNVSELSRVTFYKYYKILEHELELIHTFRPNAFYFNEKNNTFKGISNTYGRKKDAKQIHKVGEDHLTYLMKKNATIRKHKKGINQRRSASAKFNSYLNGKEYPNEELESIYNTLYQMNKEYSGDSDLMNLDRVKDLTAFKDCNFYRGEGTEKQKKVIMVY